MSEKVSAQNAPKLRKDMTKWQWTLREMKLHKVGYLMVAPYYLVFLTFTVVPVVVSLLLSLTQFNMLEMPVFVGLDNYIRLLLDDDIFLLACSKTLIFATMTGPCIVPAVPYVCLVYKRADAENPCGCNTYLLRTEYFRSGIFDLADTVFQ